LSVWRPRSPGRRGNRVALSAACLSVDRRSAGWRPKSSSPLRPWSSLQAGRPRRSVGTCPPSRRCVMAFGNVADRGSPAMAEINIIPLCDVLLVLLIIFMVTAPALSHQVDLNLPQAGSTQREPPPPVELRIASSGQVFWNGEETERTGLLARMQAEVRSHRDNQPVLQIDVAGDADYQAVVRVLATAENAGMDRIG